jgi:hypothetical protein
MLLGSYHPLSKGNYLKLLLLENWVLWLRAAHTFPHLLLPYDIVHPASCEGVGISASTVFENQPPSVKFSIAQNPTRISIMPFNNSVCLYISDQLLTMMKRFTMAL